MFPCFEPQTAHQSLHLGWEMALAKEVGFPEQALLLSAPHCLLTRQKAAHVHT